MTEKIENENKNKKNSSTEMRNENGNINIQKKTLEKYKNRLKIIMTAFKNSPMNKDWERSLNDSIPKSSSKRRRENYDNSSRSSYYREYSYHSTPPKKRSTSYSSQKRNRYTSGMKRPNNSIYGQDRGYTYGPSYFDSRRTTYNTMHSVPTTNINYRQDYNENRGKYQTFDTRNSMANQRNMNNLGRYSNMQSRNFGMNSNYHQGNQTASNRYKYDSKYGAKRM